MRKAAAEQLNGEQKILPRQGLRADSRFHMCGVYSRFRGCVMYNMMLKLQAHICVLMVCYRSLSQQIIKPSGRAKLAMPLPYGATYPDQSSSHHVSMIGTMNYVGS